MEYLNHQLWLHLPYANLTDIDTMLTDHWFIFRRCSFICFLCHIQTCYIKHVLQDTKNTCCHTADRFHSKQHLCWIPYLHNGSVPYVMISTPMSQIQCLQLMF